MLSGSVAHGALATPGYAQRWYSMLVLLTVHWQHLVMLSGIGGMGSTWLLAAPGYEQLVMRLPAGVGALSSTSLQLQAVLGA